MADDKGILPWLLLGGAGYLVYRWFSSAVPAAPLPGAGPSTGVPPLAVEGSAPAPAPGSPGGAFNSLDQIYQRLQSAIRSSIGSDPAVAYYQGVYQATPYVFNSYLSRAGGWDLSSQITTLFPNGADQKPVSLAQFWSVAASWLQQNKGLSGLGFYGTVFKMRRAV